MGNKNSYEKKAHRKQMLNGTSFTITDTKGDLGKSAMAMGRDLLLGGLAGTAAGAICGRYSFFPGVILSGAGHYFGNYGVTAFGIGMMASGGYQAAQGVNGTMNGFEGVKERLIALKEDFKRKLFLDKIIKSKKPSETSDEATNGMGDVQYFTYPISKELEGKPLNFSSLDHIEKQIELSAQKHRRSRAMSGSDEIEGVEGIEDYNF